MAIDSINGILEHFLMVFQHLIFTISYNPFVEVHSVYIRMSLVYISYAIEQRTAYNHIFLKGLLYRDSFASELTQQTNTNAYTVTMSYL